MGQHSLTLASGSGSRSTVCEAGERPDVPLRLGKALTTPLSLCAAVLSVLSLEDLGQGVEIGLEGALGVPLGHDGPS